MRYTGSSSRKLADGPASAPRLGDADGGDDGARAPDGARAGAAADEKPTLVQSAREIENALDDVAGSRRAASLRG